MLLIQLYLEFCLIGLLSVGGGLATIPFLIDLSERTGWFTQAQLTNMIAISESTPGPLGVNMATYVGYEVSGILGAATATLGLISPCIIIILLLASYLNKYKKSTQVQNIFYGLRPASLALIAAAAWSVIQLSLFTANIELRAPQSFNIEFHWASISIAGCVFFTTHWKHTKKIHPICWILCAAVAGVLLKM